MKRIITILTLASCLMLLNGQLLAQEKQLKKAETLYKNYKYNAAIPYFEYYLDIEKRKKVLSTKTKLAYCYRMSNRQDKAEKLYAELVQEDRVRPIVLFYYAEALMSNGKYAEAKTWFMKYEILEPDDEKVALMIEACEKVTTIEPVFSNVFIEPVGINTQADEFSPIFYDDGIAFLSDQGERGSSFAWTGRPFLKLYKSTKESNGAFVEIKELSKRINSYKKNTGPVSLSRDGNRMVITRNSDVPSKRNRFHMQLFEATRKSNGSWTRGLIMSFCKVNKNYMHPAFSPSGDTLYFASDKGGGQGGTDIWMTYKTARGWRNPINLGGIINTNGHEAFPFVGIDGTLYFCSKGHVGFGGFDIFKAERGADGEFVRVVNLGEPFNGAKDDTGFIISDDNSHGYFASSRMAGNDDIYRFELVGVVMKGDMLTYDNNYENLNRPKAERSFNNQKVESIDLKAKVTDTKGKALNNVKIVVETISGDIIKEIPVDANGNIDDMLTKGEDYILKISKIGYQSEQVFITTDILGKTINRTFKLQKK